MSTEPAAPALSRRTVISGSIASLAALMLHAGVTDAKTLAQGATDHRYPFADRLSDLLLPTTTTPGAAKAQTALFMLLALDTHMGGLTPELLERVRVNLDAAAGGSFMHAAHTRQMALLEALDQACFAQPEPAVNSAEHAWRRIKSAIVAGYYTSEIGASKELVYEPVPGRFENITLTADFVCRSNDGFGGSL